MIEGILIGGGVMAVGVIIGALVVATTVEYIWGDCGHDTEKDNTSDGEN